VLLLENRKAARGETGYHTSLLNLGFPFDSGRAGQQHKEYIMTVTVEQILRDTHPETRSDDNTYRLFKLDENFSFSKLTGRDLQNHKSINNFSNKDKLVVVQNSEIIYIED
jgi:hypothetical protein